MGRNIRLKGVIRKSIRKFSPLPFLIWSTDIPKIGTNRSEQILQNNMRLIMKGILMKHCLSFHLHLLNALLHSKTEILHFYLACTNVVEELLHYFKHWYWLWQNVKV